MELSKEIANRGDDVDFIADKICEYFYPEVKENKLFYMQEFSVALTIDKPRYVPYFVCLRKLDTAKHFIDTVTYSDNKMYRDLFQSILRPMWWFGKVNPDEVNLYEGKKIMQSFIKESTKLRRRIGISIIPHLRLQLVK